MSPAKLNVERLRAGLRLGPYQILDRAGAGGMGEVYRALDQRLGRTVAIKIVRSDFALAHERFVREAKAIGGLNHPNICTLYDVGEVDGLGFLVMHAWRRYWPAVAVTVAYGVLDELHQQFVPGRFPSGYDALADTVGALLGAAALVYFTRLSRRRHGDPA